MKSSKIIIEYTYWLFKSDFENHSTSQHFRNTTRPDQQTNPVISAERNDVFSNNLYISWLNII